jgi:hypothetical protein
MLRLLRLVFGFLLCILLLFAVSSPFALAECCGTPLGGGICEDGEYAETFGCCGVGACNIFCCNCDGGCRQAKNIEQCFKACDKKKNRCYNDCVVSCTFEPPSCVNNCSQACSIGESQCRDSCREKFKSDQDCSNFAAVDIDKNGQIDIDEFSTFFSQANVNIKYFDLIDSNEDGLISLDEAIKAPAYTQ